jgi:YD repeat-containing protein
MWGWRGRIGGWLTGCFIALIASMAPVASGASGADTAESPAPQAGTSLASATKVVRELPGLRTANSDTYLQSDGSRLLKISGSPVNYKVAGAWQPINDTLQPGADGSSHPAASPTPVNFPASLGSGPVTIGPANQRLSFSLQGASASGTSTGTEQSYPGALPGVEVSYATSPESVRETLTLASASAPTTYRYSLSLSDGMKASLSPGGGVAIRDASGKLVYSLATPSLADSSGKAHLPWTAPVHYELSGDGSVLSLVLDKAWLEDPARVFPVKIDPDVYFGGYQDCTIASQTYANTSLCNERLFVGTNTESPKSVARALVQFDTSSIPKGSTILSSSLALWFEATTTSSPIEIEAYALNKEHPFTQEATWNSYDGTHAWITPGGDHLKTEAGSTVVKPEWTGGWTSYGFTPQVEQWVRDPTSNDGILLKAHNETATGYDTFVQTGNGEGKPEPNLNVVYEPLLGDPANESMYQLGIGNGGTLGVNVANGNLHLTDPDVNYSTEGYATTLARSYNSYDDEYTTSSFGDGWRLNMGEDELLYPAWWDGSNVLHQSDGSYTRFDRASWADGHPSAGDKAYTNEAYVPATLTVHENDTRSLTYNNTGVEWQYDNSENGFPQKIVDPGGEGNTISLSYTSSHLTKVTDTHSHTLNLTRNATTKYITKIKPTSGESWEYTYNSSHLLTKYKGPEGQKAEYGYNGEGMVTSIVDPTGTLVISYSEYRVASIRKLVNGTISTPGSEDEVTTFSYETEQTTVTNPEGATAVYGYDQFGNRLEESSTQEAASEAYEKYAGIEATAARKDVDLQDHAAILDSQLSAQLSEAYVGEWFNSAAGKIVLGITSESYEKTVAQDLDNLGLADNAEVAIDPYSDSTLEAAQPSLESKLSELVEANLVMIGLEYSQDALVIEKANDLSSEQNSRVAEAVSGAGVPVVVHEVATAHFDVRGQAETCTVVWCPRPIRGGVSIQHGTYKKSGGSEELVGRAFCTAGFVVQSEYGPLKYVLTAGHCVYDEGLGAKWFSQYKSSEASGQRYLGEGVAYVDGKQHSFFGSVSNHGDMGLIAIASSGESGAFAGTSTIPLRPWIINYGASAGEPRNEHYVIHGTAGSPGGRAKSEQFVVCVSAAPTAVNITEIGESEGLEAKPKPVASCGVTGGSYTAHYERAGEESPEGVELLHVCLENGASGAPVFKHGLAYGTISGGSSGECREYYQGIETSEKVLHVHVLKG